MSGRKIKILNLYAGIGGNRKLWGGNIEVTAVESDPKIAAVYQALYPDDIVIVGDAHAYLLEHYKEFDFIWGSPPCQSHSDIRRCVVHKGQCEALYPDMKLYQEIIFLQNFALKTTKWCIENVRPYYQPLIKPTVELHRHLIWSNCSIPKIEIKDDRVHNNIVTNSTVYGINLDKYDIPSKSKIRMLRNMVNPELGKYVLDRMMEKEILVQGNLFTA